MAEASRIGMVSLARCAELLTKGGDRIERSALSRYCKTHDLKGAKEGREVLVDFETVRDHRAANYQREVMAGGRAIAPAVDAVPLQAPTADVIAIPAKDDPQRGLKAAQLRQVLRAEALEAGRLTETAQVDAGAAEAIVQMRSAFSAARADLAERLAAELGLQPERVRILRAGLKRYDRIGQERFAAVMARSLQAGNETEGDAVARLTELTAHAVRIRSRKDGARRTA